MASTNPRLYAARLAYEIEIPSGKGPRVLTSTKELIAPDLLATKWHEATLHIRWIEAKHKSHFTWHRNSSQWQTGVDVRHYEDYIKVQEQTRIDVFLLFLHLCAQPSASDLKNGSPLECPTGLFGGSLRYLMRHVHHKERYCAAGREYPMVYWNHCDLKRLATLEQINAVGETHVSA